MAAKKQESISELIESHRPKHFKYVYVLKEDAFERLKSEEFDMETLDTLHRPDLMECVKNAMFTEYDRTIIGKAKEPTILGNGLIVSKLMITKSDKKLLGVDIGEFIYEEIPYIVIRFRYEFFDIYEFFISFRTK